jgi:hypothetical protein
MLAAVLVFTGCGPDGPYFYTWTDAKGVVNVSNLTPPDGVQAEKIVRETPRANVPAPVVSSPMAESAAQAEVQFLAQRVRQLEYEVDFARRQPPPPPPMDYAFYPPPPSPAMQYTVDTAPQQQAYGCDPSWFGCSGWSRRIPVGVSFSTRRTSAGRYQAVVSTACRCSCRCAHAATPAGAEFSRACGASVVYSSTTIVPSISSWPVPQKMSQTNVNVPVLSGTIRRRATFSGMMSARTPKSGALKPITTSRVVSSSTTGTPFLSLITLGV